MSSDIQWHGMKTRWLIRSYLGFSPGINLDIPASLRRHCMSRDNLFVLQTRPFFLKKKKQLYNVFITVRLEGCSLVSGRKFSLLSFFCGGFWPKLSYSLAIFFLECSFHLPLSPLAPLHKKWDKTTRARQQCLRTKFWDHSLLFKFWFYLLGTQCMPMCM